MTQSVPKGWRSRGWTPLVYPKSALQGLLLKHDNNSNNTNEAATENKLNALFPMHRNILISQIRELLLLDGTLSAETLEVRPDVVEFTNTNTGVRQVMARYKAHNTMDDNSKEENSGRWEPTTKSSPDSKKASLPCSKLVTEKGTLPSAEIVVQQIVDRALSSSLSPSGKQAIEDESSPTDTCLVRRHPLSARKISDAENDTPAKSASSQPPLLMSSNDVSRFLRLEQQQQEEGKDTIVFQHQESMPPLLEVSISSEENLRRYAVALADRILLTVANGTLKRYFGYPQSAHLPRERLVQAVAQLWFDTSHALFAYEQTEVEERGKPRTRSIRDTLFDARALQKLGGWHPYAVLPQALSLRRHEMTWKQWAKKYPRFLAHHRSTKDATESSSSSIKDSLLLKAGQERRGNRLRRRRNGPPSPDHDTVVTARSRSSSIASSVCSTASSKNINGHEGGSPEKRSDIPESVEAKAPTKSVTATAATTTELTGDETSRAPSPTPTDDSSSSMGGSDELDEEDHDDEPTSTTTMAATTTTTNPAAKRQKIVHMTSVSLTRDSPSTSWGVLLGKKDRHTCIVLRASSSQLLRVGDQVLQVRNPETNTAVASKDSTDWFRRMVGVFKSSQELELIVRREA